MGDWNDSRYFIALARARTLAGAARELGVDLRERSGSRRRKPVMRGNSLIAALNACVMGMGIAWVPFFLAANEPTRRRIGTERGDVRDLGLVVHPDLARVGRIAR